MADQKKKMNLTQLTFIVTVNMMGSGIIMLPSNMAKVGAISLLSWIVTAVGSLALAWGFARPGSSTSVLAAWPRMRKTHMQGRLLPDFLPLLHLAGDRERRGREFRARLRVGVRAGDHVEPVITCAGVIALLWITTFANFGGPKLTGRIGALTVWGVILPVGFIPSPAGSGSAARRSRQPGTRGDQPERRRGVEHLAHAVAFLGLESARRTRTPSRTQARRAARLHAGHGRRRGHLHPLDDRDPGHRAQRGPRRFQRSVRSSPSPGCSIRRSAPS